MEVRVEIKDAAPVKDGVYVMSYPITSSQSVKLVLDAVETYLLHSFAEMNRLDVWAPS